MKKLLLLPLLLLCAYSVQAQAVRFDLKNDVLGESLATFKAHHPKIYCYDVNDVELACKDPEASFAGHNPYLCPKDHKDCLDGGLGADFYRGQLKYISYRVSGGYMTEGGNVLELLTNKFGKPSDRYGVYGGDGLAGAEWETSTEHIVFTISSPTITGKWDGEISVYLEYKKDPSKGDI